MNLIITIFFFIKNDFSLAQSFDIKSQNNNSEEYVPLRFLTQKTFIITNPCHTEKSILIRNNTLYKFDQEQFQWKRLCVSQNILNQQIPIVNSIAHLNNDLILIIHGILFRTHDIISSIKNEDIIYRISRYSNLPILFEKIDSVFTTPCCTCLKNTTYRSISHAFNDYVILANKYGNVILFYFKSMSIVYDFGNIFQTQPICKSRQCTILHLGLFHAVPILMCVVKYENDKALIYHQSFLELNSTFQKLIYINFTGDSLYITPTTYHNSYFFWDIKKIYYTTNGGLLLSEVQHNGCELDYLDNMNESQLQDYYINLEIDYDNITLLTKEIYCFNKTIDYIFILNKDFFIITENNDWFYGKETFFPSIIKLEQKNECNPTFQDLSVPNFNFNITQCLLNINQQTLPCSSFIQSTCSYIRFEPLFDINQLYILEKNTQKYFEFILEAYTIIPIMIVSTESTFFNYMINYTINHMNNGIIQIIGVSNEMRQNLPTNIIHQFSPLYIKRKQSDSTVLKYQYCFNETCQSIDSNQLDSLLIYAIPLTKEHENYAHYLFNRSDSCVPISQSIYRLWLQLTLNTTSRKQPFRIPYERRTSYRTLLNMFSIPKNSCLFYNASNSIHINKTINQSSYDHLKFLIHIIAYNNKYSYCDLETFILLEIEPVYHIHTTYRGYVFLITLFLFILLFILFIHIYTYYKYKQRQKYLEYHRLNQIDAGQFHQWYDVAQYLNKNKHTNNYDSIHNYLLNLEPTNNLTKRLIEYHHK
ncbi:unnamed protein product [Adineta steineri]|uniref:Transmembrane protein n=1 Tax=Adineta steineri TaxID=433720 RepID=A0A814Z9T6_9BILA|nr:unnamed protein product [Adineta steineri]